jgi:hypothetical protein
VAVCVVFISIAAIASITINIICVDAMNALAMARASQKPAYVDTSVFTNIRGRQANIRGRQFHTF